jgi:Cysteine-rich secretory protein family
MKRTLLAILLGASAGAAGVQAPPDAASPEQQLFRLVNHVRQGAGLEKLRWDSKLANAAQFHSQELAAHQNLSHQFPGEPQLTERLSVTGVRFSAAAENVALADTAEEAHLGFMSSPGHRANIMSAEYNAIGIAVVELNKRLYVTEDFGRVVPNYSADQFREGVIAAFNRLRRSHRMMAIESHADPRLDANACTGDQDPRILLEGFSGPARATIFSANQPNDLPPTMDHAAADISLRRMNIGVCLRPDPQTKAAKFWVVVAFYATK